MLSLGACGRTQYEIEVPAATGRVLLLSNPDDPHATSVLQPLGNAVVRVEWWAKVDVLVDNGFACVRSEDTVSASNGEFVVAAWKNRRRGVYDIEWRAYAPGYATKESAFESVAPGERLTLKVHRVNGGAMPAAQSSEPDSEFGCWEHVSRK
jgi:hypothetical protein